MDTEEPVDTGDDPLSTTWPETLSATGLYADIASRTLADDVVSYEVAWPLWSDGAVKSRHLWLPEGETIDVSSPDLWQVPVGAKAWKSFTRDGVLVETRYIERLSEHEWIRIAYVWRSDGSDADPAPDGEENASGTAHDVPARADCDHCHRGDGLIGVQAIQLGADSPTGTLDALAAAGRLSGPISGSTAVPGDGVAREALGYLHGNCGGCHADSYPLAAHFSLRLRVLVGTDTPEESLAYTTAINAPTNHQSTTSVAIVPGDPAASQVYERMGRRDAYSMPPVGTELVDEPALATVHEWISGLPTE